MYRRRGVHGQEGHQLIARRVLLPLFVAGCAGLAAALGAPASHSGTAASTGRPPPPEAHFVGIFHRAGWESSIDFFISADGTHLGRTQGVFPSTCRSRRDGKLKRPGRDGAVGFVFDLDFTSDAVIGPDGSFMFTARNDSTNSDLDPAVFTVRGTFSGSTVLGRITGRTTKTRRNSLYTTCTGNQVFWAKRGG